MKLSRKCMVGLLAVWSFALLAGCGDKAPSSAAASPITEETAKQTALEHAGVTESDVNFTKVKLDTDHGRQEYDIEFVKDGTEYDYEIDASTGDILSYSTDTKPAAPTASGEVAITEDQAKEIALNHAGFTAADVNFTKVKLDNDDGRQEYEIEFIKDGTEYDYEIDAASGDILSYDVEKR